MTTKVKETEMKKSILETLAVELYRERKISLGKAAEIAGARNKWEMLIILNKRGVAIDYTAENAEKDLETLKKVLKGDDRGKRFLSAQYEYSGNGYDTGKGRV
jgi:predicted HTH domain antitoxin